VWRQRIECAPHLGARLVDRADREKRAAAAQRPAAARRGNLVHAIAGGLEHAPRGVEILALEIAVEGVGKEHHLLALARGGLVPKNVAAPSRQTAPLREP